MTAENLQPRPKAVCPFEINNPAEHIHALVSMVNRGGVTEPEAIRYFGYQWWSFMGVPIRSTIGYPAQQRVRQLLSPAQFLGERWRMALADSQGAPATGQEPLSYTYESSGSCVATFPSVGKIAVSLVRHKLLITYPFCAPLVTRADILSLLCGILDLQGYCFELPESSSHGQQPNKS